MSTLIIKDGHGLMYHPNVSSNPAEVLKIFKREMAGFGCSSKRPSSLEKLYKAFVNYST